MIANVGRRQILKLLCLMPLLCLQGYSGRSSKRIRRRDEFVVVDGWILKLSDLSGD